MIAIIDYKAGNLTSVKLALDAIGVESVITDSTECIESADRIIFPGVGAAGSAMATLEGCGLADVIRKTAASGKPFLGICLGTQIILSHSEEDNAECLGIISGSVIKFRPKDRFDKVPQIGWNSVSFARKHPVFDGIEKGSEFYFVHSFYPRPEFREDVIAETDYAGVNFASVLGRNNVVATQFHPEKSGRLGLRLLENFSKWSGRPD